jgi:Zn-dependent membrane protease YugP
VQDRQYKTVQDRQDKTVQDRQYKIQIIHFRSILLLFAMSGLGLAWSFVLVGIFASFFLAFKWVVLGLHIVFDHFFKEIVAF